MKTLILLFLITGLTTTNAQPDFSKCDKILAKIQAETNPTTRVQLGMDLLSCMNEVLPKPVPMPLSPPPEALPPANNTNTVWLHKKPEKHSTFTVTCAHCRMKFKGVPATITTNGSYAVVGGTKIQRTITFTCPNFDCQAINQANDEKFAPAAIAIEEEDPSPKTGGASIKSFVQPLVITDTNPPVVTSFAVNQADITNFTNRVNFAYRVGHFSYWQPGIGMIVTKAFEVTWPVKSNDWYMAFHTDNLNNPWIEYPLDQSVHPARGDVSNYTTLFPIFNGNHFYTVRSKPGNGYTYQ